MSARRGAAEAAGATCAEAVLELRGRAGAATSFAHAAAACSGFPRCAAKSHEKANTEAIAGTGDRAGDATSPARSSVRPEAARSGPAGRCRGPRMTSYLVGLRCISCGAPTTDRTRDPLCPACGGFLQAEYDLDKMRAEVDRDALAAQPRGMWRWSCLLPVRDERHLVTLQEGDTPLPRMQRLEAEFGCPRFFIKDESRNPTGSFKDRGASVTAGKCREVGIEHLVIVSSGNASAAMSAYCARAGLRLTALMRPETVPGHLLQNLICGTNALVVDGDMVEGTRLAQQAADRYGWFHAAQPYNLYRIKGKKTLAFEIAEALGWRAPDRILIPTGGGTNVLALHLGFSQLHRPRLGRPHAGAGRGAIHRLRTQSCAPDSGTNWSATGAAPRRASPA